MSKAFVIDIAKCSGCYGCQVSCKDEFCEQPWLPYSEAQPLTGQFWCRVDEKERGRTPVVTVSYVPVICSHCEDCALAQIGGDAVYRRDDGLVVIDPALAKGRRDLVDACPLGAVYWNDDLQIPQKCTGCAHLLDDGWAVPRCVDSCAHGAIQFGELADLDTEGAEFLPQTAALGPQVYYKNLPKRFAAGCVYDPGVNDIVEGARVALLAADGAELATTQSDYLGDWKFDQIASAAYRVRIEAEGYEPVELDVDVTDKDEFVGDWPLTFVDADGARTPAKIDPPRNLHSRQRRPLEYVEEEAEVVELSARLNICELQKHDEAVAVIEEFFPGLLANEEVMGKVGGMSFAVLAVMKPDAFDPARIAQMDERLRALN